MQFGEFIEKWRGSAASERANKDSFLNDLCAVLGVPAPNPMTGDAKRDHYVFEKAVQVSTETGRTTKFIDLYKHGSFVLEAKQGSASSTGKLGTAKRDTPTWNVAMNAAFGQAIDYASALEQPPPFIIVTDIGYCFDIYASFDGSPRYRPFPNALSHRFFLTRIAERADTLRAIFTDPLSLDPSKVAVEVTREVAAHLADLTRRLEKAGHAPESVADFLMRCIFTMFAEDVGLLPEEMFTVQLRDHWIKSPRSFTQGVENLWRAMNDGSVFGFFGKLLHFNGGLFKSPAALPLDKGDLEVLLEAASCRWNKVEPAIFGALFEGALDEKERHSLGAHFTPRAYVERLVRPTVEEPIREDWTATQEKIRSLAANNKIKEAKGETRAFMKRLSEVRVLDPACGSGNFLYVALDLLKAIEDEAFALLFALEGGQTELCLDAPEVTPRQFLGIEVNPRAKAIAELVLWIGYLQWHFRTKHRGGKPREPVLEDYKNIEYRDAVLSYDTRELARDPRSGKPLSQWDGKTMKRHPATGQPVPDERFTTPRYEYSNAGQAVWPRAQFIVGNPPFIGNKRMRDVLSDAYVEALRKAHPDVAESADYVMYWWNRGAELVRRGEAERSGFITTNSITQSFNRRVVQRALESKPVVSLTYAIPDHPWVDKTDGAAVRIAMTVVSSGEQAGYAANVVESAGNDVQLVGRHGRIASDLSIHNETHSIMPLIANRGLSGQGVKVVGDGFYVEEGFAGEDVSPATGHCVVRRVINPQDVLKGRTGRFIIDFFGLSEQEARIASPRAFQRVIERVKPIRDQNNRDSIRKLWWRFAWERPVTRAALKGLPRYFVTLETSKHRFFVPLPENVLWDGSLFAVALSDWFHFGVLSSRVHTVWALAQGGRLEDRPRWQSGSCFDPFPFPDPHAALRVAVRKAGQEIDAHRTRQQSAHAGLTITELYNVLAKLREGASLDDKERLINERGLVSILNQFHEQLDTAVMDAYGWPHDLTDSEILERLVTLNAERATEEENGHIRWLRPEFQATGAEKAELIDAGEDDVAPVRTTRKGPGIRSIKPDAAKVRRKSGGKT